MEAVHALVRELALFEKEPEAVITNAEIFRQDAFGERPKFEVLIAESEQAEVMGMALFFPAYSSWRGSFIHLDDLIVSEVYRGHGIGGKLLEALTDLALERGAQLLKWEVLDWNKPAVDFYKHIGAKIAPEWWKVTFYPDQMRAFKAGRENRTKKEELE
jgi:GNAT superfamily N-acetyltransferase